MRQLCLVFVMMLMMGSAYAASLLDGVNAFDNDHYAAAYKILLPYAKHGNPEAQYYFGRMYYEGSGVAKDLGKALYWYTKSASYSQLSHYPSCRVAEYSR